MPPGPHSPRSRRSPAQSQLSEPALAGVDKGVTDIGDALGPDAYWRARTWKRVLVIFAGPAANIIFAFILFTGLFMTSGGKATTTVDSVRVKTSAAALGLQSGDKIVSINGKPMTSGKHDLGHDRRLAGEASSRSSSSANGNRSRSGRGRRRRSTEPIASASSSGEPACRRRRPRRRRAASPASCPRASSHRSATS